MYATREELDRQFNARGFPVTCFEVEDRNHFDVILDWQSPDTRLTRAAMELFDEPSNP